MDEWKQIWNKDERINKIILESLVKADGFNSGAGSFTINDGSWDERKEISSSSNGKYVWGRI